MDEQKYTTRVVEAINKGMEISKENHLSSFDVPSLLRAIFDQEGSMYVSVLKSLGIDVKAVSQTIDEYLNNSVKTDNTNQPEASSDLQNLLYSAQKYQKKM